MVTRLRVRGYKSFQSLNVRLGPLTVLFGPNAAGKSNFLDALQLLSRLATSPRLKDAFAPPHRGTPLESFNLPQGGVRKALEMEALTFSIEADIQFSQTTIDFIENKIRELKRGFDGGANGNPSKPQYVTERHVRYRIEVQIRPRAGHLQVVDEFAAALSSKGEVRKNRRRFLEVVESNGQRRIHRRMEGQAHPTYFDLGLDHTVLSEPVYEPHAPHLAALKHELERWQFFYFEPRESMRAPNVIKETAQLGHKGEDLGSFLNTLRVSNPRQYQALQKNLKVLIPSITDLSAEPNALGEVELTLVENGKPIPARLVSEGTLRVLGLLAIVSTEHPPSLVGFEEPENGIHPRRIELIASLLENYAARDHSQLIVTTHSPLLLDRLPRQALYACRKEHGETKVDQGIEPLFQAADLSDGDEGAPISTALLRGDFDA